MQMDVTSTKEWTGGVVEGVLACTISARDAKIIPRLTKLAVPGRGTITPSNDIGCFNNADL